MALLKWGAWTPDTADYEAEAAKYIINAVPRADGYGPFPSVSTYTGALADTCRGAFYALKSDGTVTTFAGTLNKLYKLNNTDYTWEDASKASGTYTDLSTDAQWEFAQFGNLVFATQANDVLQVYDLSSSTEFADCGGSPPQAAYVQVVGRFLVLSGLLSNPYRIQWSGLNATTTWTSGTNSSDFQDFPDGGIVRAVAGGESGIIFQDQAIRRMSYVPGSPLIFQIDRISQDKGLFAPYSVVRAGERIFFYSTQGFQKIEPGGYPEQIGRERVDRTFLADLDKSTMRVFIGAADPRTSRVYWAYKSLSGPASLFDKILGYDTVLDRFFQIETTGEYLLGLSQTGITLEALDAISASADALLLSFDAYPTSVQPELAQFSDTHKLGFYRGDNLSCTLQSGEQGADGQKIFVRGFRPITDAATVYGACSYRDALNATAAIDPEVLINSRTGRCDLRRDTRYVRVTARMPAGTDWTFSAGVELDIVPGGTL